VSEIVALSSHLLTVVVKKHPSCQILIDKSWVCATLLGRRCENGF